MQGPPPSAHARCAVPAAQRPAGRLAAIEPIAAFPLLLAPSCTSSLVQQQRSGAQQVQRLAGAPALSRRQRAAAPFSAGDAAPVPCAALLQPAGRGARRSPRSLAQRRALRCPVSDPAEAVETVGAAGAGAAATPCRRRRCVAVPLRPPPTRSPQPAPSLQSMLLSSLDLQTAMARQQAGWHNVVSGLRRIVSPMGGERFPPLPLAALHVSSHTHQRLPAPARRPCRTTRSTARSTQHGGSKRLRTCSSEPGAGGLGAGWRVLAGWEHVSRQVGWLGWEVAVAGPVSLTLLADPPHPPCPPGWRATTSESRRLSSMRRCTSTMPPARATRPSSSASTR